MGKLKPRYVRLKIGKIRVYDFGKIKIHAYQNNDPLNDETFILSKDGKGIILEPPSFVENIKELTEYIQSTKLEIEGIIAAYHLTGATFLPDVKRYSTKEAEFYGTSGAGKGIVDKFAKVFGAAFDSSLPTIGKYFTKESLTLAGIQLRLRKTAEAFDIELPEINCIYIHMLGHNAHSIVIGTKQRQAMLDQLYYCLEQKFELILTSHHIPENLQDVQTKINYLENLQKLVTLAKSATEFKASMQKAYPNYSGLNYLEMTAGFLFAP